MNTRTKRAIWVIFSILAVVLIGLVVLIVQANLLKSQPAISEKIGITSSEKISTIVIPHFNTFQSERRDFLKEVSAKLKAQKIVLISVNHYGLGGKDFLTTNRSWDFSTSDPKINSELFDSLTKSGQVSSDDTVFENEHGIKNVLSLIHI